MKHRHEVRNDLDRLHGVIVELFDVTIVINQILSEVPGDFRIALSLEPLPETTSIVSHNVALREDWEVNSIGLSEELMDLLLRVGFLSAELIAGEGNDLQAT